MQTESDISDDHSVNNESISAKNTVNDIGDEPLNLFLNSSWKLRYFKQAISKKIFISSNIYMYIIFFYCAIKKPEC